MADLIPSDVWFDHIFLKLQVKSLLRCKCVSKKWNSVIIDPDFARKHLHLHKHQRVLLQLRQLDYVSVDIGTGDTHKVNKVTPYMKIIGSSNGLLCALVGLSHWKTLEIWNPTTGDLKLVKKGPSLHHIHNPVDVNRFGFCYDSVNNDFKIVYLNSKKSGREMKIKFDLYSLKSDSWKIMRDFDGASNLDDITPTTRGYDVDGTIYWIVTQNSISFDILVFNISKNKFRKLQLPRTYTQISTPYITNLLVLGSSLGVYQYSARNKRVLLWKLKVESEEWIELMRITQSSRLYDIENLCPIGLTASMKVVLVSSQKSVPKKGFLLYDDQRSKNKFRFYEEMSKTNFMLHDEVTNKIKNLHVRGICHVQPIMQKEVYVESLVSPHTFTVTDDVSKKKRRSRNDDNSNKNRKRRYDDN